MPTPKIIEIDEEQDVVECPICSTPAIDEDGLVSQPSCPHISFVYANGEAFEYDPEGLEMRLQAEQDKADENGVYFDPWETLPSLCSKDDLILSQVSEGMACGAVSFTVWIGIRHEQEEPKSRRLHLLAAADDEYSARDHRIFFQPTAKFNRWIAAEFSGKLIYDLGSGMGHVAKALAKAGMRVTAIDFAPRTESEFDVMKADGTQFPFEKDSVVMFCRPSHSGFVERTIAKAVQSHVAAIVYVGLCNNFKSDVGSIQDCLTRSRVADIGHAGERIWVLDVGRFRTEASRRRSIPRLSSNFSL